MYPFDTSFGALRSMALGCMLAVVSGACVFGTVMWFVDNDHGPYWLMAAGIIGLLGTFITYLGVEEILRNRVRQEIGINEATLGISFMEKALCYLGYETKKLTDNAVVADGNMLVYVNSYLNEDDMAEIVRLESKEKCRVSFAIDRRFSATGPYDVYILAHRNGMGLMDMRHVFDAVYRQMRTGGPKKVKQPC